MCNFFLEHDCKAKGGTGASSGAHPDLETNKQTVIFFFLENGFGNHLKVFKSFISAVYYL